LAGILVVAAALRFTGLGWGIGRGTSFHPDEDKILWQLEGMRLGALDLDPKDFGWGTLQTYLVGATVFALDRLGGYGGGWRSAFRERREPFFGRLFVTGRLVSALFGVLTVAVVAAIGWQRGGARASLLAASLLGVSPLHVLHSHYLTADVALGLWLSLAVWAHGRSAVLSGFFAGLALATKPSALPVVALVVALAPAARGRLLAAAVGGFLLGEPYALLAFGAWWSASLETASRIGSTAPEAFGLAELAWRHGVQVLLYGLGPVAALAAVMGLSRVGRLLAAATAGLALTLALSRFPMGRYAVPLLPFLAVAAGLAMARLHGLRIALAVTAALGPELLYSGAAVAQLGLVHPYQRAADWIESNVPAGASLARLWAEYPPLEPGRHRLEMLQDPFALEGRAYAPQAADVVVLDDLPLHAWRSELLADLAQNYREAARFGPQRPLPEPWRPHDSRYPGPAVRVLLRTAYR
jgi:hypothetical protein